MRLSVVVTIVDGGDALDRCLAALAAQDAPASEVLIPWDDSVTGLPALAGRYPAFRFLPMGAVSPDRPAFTAAGQHELYDRRRAAGLSASTGDIVAVLEDRGAPRPDWARAMVAAHTRLPHAAIGGAIQHRSNSALNWAVYFCDFGRFQLPFEAGARAWVSDINIGYKRRALEATRELWRDRYHETTVHWALQRAGETLFLTPEIVVDHLRGRLTPRAALAERFAWGRLFAYTRARELSLVRRWTLAVLAPLLPIVLLARHASRQAANRATLGTFLKASPAMFGLLVAWSAGEAIGYATGRA